MMDHVFRLLDIIAEFQQKVKERLMVISDHQIHQINESINIDQINNQNHQVLNDHLQFHQQIQHHVIHHNDHKDHM